MVVFTSKVVKVMEAASTRVMVLALIINNNKITSRIGKPTTTMTVKSSSSNNNSPADLRLRKLSKANINKPNNNSNSITRSRLTINTAMMMKKSIRCLINQQMLMFTRLKLVQGCHQQEWALVSQQPLLKVMISSHLLPLSSSSSISSRIASSNRNLRLQPLASSANPKHPR